MSGVAAYEVRDALFAGCASAITFDGWMVEWIRRHGDAALHVRMSTIMGVPNGDPPRVVEALVKVIVVPIPEKGRTPS